MKENNLESISNLIELAVGLDSTKSSIDNLLLKIFEVFNLEQMYFWYSDQNKQECVFQKTSSIGAAKQKPNLLTIESLIKKGEFIILNKGENVEEKKKIKFEDNHISAIKINPFKLLLISRSGAEFKAYKVKLLLSLFKILDNNLMKKTTVASLEKEISEEKEKHTELKASAKEYKTVVTNLSEGIIITDSKGNITYVNDKLCNLTGYSKEELLGENADVKLVPPNQQKIVSEKTKSRKKKLSDEYVVEHQKKDGSKFMGRIKASPVFDENKNVIGTIGAVADVTKVLEAEKEIEAKQKKYEDLFSNINEGFIVLDALGRVEEANDAGIKILGLDPSDFMKVSLGTLVHPDDKERSKTYIDKLINDGFYKDYEGRIIRKDGTIRLLRVSSTAIIENGEFIGSRDIVRDITDLKKAELELKKNELKLTKIIDNALDCFLTIDRKGIIQEWNSQAEKVFGYSRKDAVGQVMSELIMPPQFRDMHNAGVSKYFKTGKGPVLNKRIEISAINKEGDEFPIELSITPIKIEQEEFFSAFLRDISERKKSEEELLKAKQAAENAQLVEQQFLANMSHEIRTPMNSVIGITHLLYESNPTNLQLEYLDLLRFAADNLMGIISNILDLSKIEAGEIEFENRPFSIREMLKSLKQTYQYKVKEKPVSVVAEIDQNIDKLVMGDSIRVNQILSNLLSNSAKFTESGTIGVKANLLTAENENILIEFEVYDTGIGINKSSLSSIFKSFKQADNTISRKYGGSGLGLAIVKELTELMGGKISVKSKLDEGSSFIVNLPFQTTSVTEEQKHMAISPANNKKELANSRVLVVEDNMMNQKLIHKIFEIWECKFDTAENGKEAIEFTEQNKYDIILMDLHMPIMDGVNATKIIRADKSNLNNTTPIIALTAAALQDEKNRALDAGMEDFVTKPFSPNMLYSTVCKWLNIQVKQKEEEKKDDISIDLSYLKEISSGDTDFIREMLQTFIDEMPNHTIALIEAIEKNDLTAAYGLAHKMKPNFQLIGIRELEKVAEEIERIAKKEMNDKNQKLIESQSKFLYQTIQDLLPELEIEKKKYLN